jgi:hypothetical protein
VDAVNGQKLLQCLSRYDGIFWATFIGYKVERRGEREKGEKERRSGNYGEFIFYILYFLFGSLYGSFLAWLWQSARATW